MAIEQIESEGPTPHPPPGERESVYQGFAYFEGEIVPLEDAQSSKGTHGCN